MNGCTTATCVVVTQPAAIQHLFAATNISCFGGSNGTIDLTVTGGNPPHTYVWSTGATTEDITGVTAGTYTVSTTDTKGCTKVTSITLTEPNLLVATATTIPVSCFGGNNGSIDATVTGGTTPYTYNWSNGAVSQDISGLTAGTYTLTVTDVKGCTTVVSATVTQPTDLVLSTITVPATCGSANGSIDLTVSGGTPTYAYKLV